MFDSRLEACPSSGDSIYWVSESTDASSENLHCIGGSHANLNKTPFAQLHAKKIWEFCIQHYKHACNVRNVLVQENEINYLNNHTGIVSFSLQTHDFFYTVALGC